MKRNFLVLSAFFFTLGYYSCIPESSPECVIEKEHFHLSPGNWWEYKITHSYNSISDTMRLEIKSKQIVGQEEIYSCTIETENAVTDSLKIIASDSMIIFLSGNIFFKNLTIPLSNRVGSSWQNSPLDTFSVISCDNHLFVNDSYFDAFFIKRFSFGFNYHLNHEIYLSKDAGIIKEIFDEFNLAPTTIDTLSLLNFHVL